ncbi:hypothetical protein [Leeuwenhoekiella nanhaiensis]|uniref:Uncharacterized protein n=1 Tax=Leeuwenhoekiella nanhaiensis TaxID=1655491 RepID=A0A2G1VMZ1_9FLAO|nr:hypothetical protein [Leeuwenhoekiella nanhaiensis]PHQ28146.1 hypothetical protein CJ305_16585 [Leeuwenhoekiella nanhaiensis]
MNWEQIDTILKAQIANKSSIQDGYSQIKKVLTDNELLFVDIDIDKLKKEFDKWLADVITKEPIPKNIKSLYFGLATLAFPEIDDGKEQTTVYLAGSRLTPKQGEDWACDTAYFPNRRYLLPTEFEKIDNVIKSNDNLGGDYEVFVFNGLLNLLVLDALTDFKDSLMNYQDKKLGFFKTSKKRDSMHFGAGFDSGELYLLGELKNDY